jgi:hypothetical protein
MKIRPADVRVKNDFKKGVIRIKKPDLVPASCNWGIPKRDFIQMTGIKKEVHTITARTIVTFWIGRAF